MKDFTDFLFLKPTLFSVLGILLLVIGIPSGIYGLTLKGGSSLGGTLILIGCLLIGVIFIIDRVIVQFVNQKKVNIFESIILFLFIIYYFAIK